MRCLPSRDDLRAWNRHDRRAFDRAVSNLLRYLNRDDYSLVQQFPTLSASMRSTIAEEATDGMIERLDNYVNRGDVRGGLVWSYITPLTERNPPIAPPGATGDRLRCHLTIQKTGQPREMDRAYRYEEGFDDPRFLAKEARLTFHRRVQDMYRSYKRERQAAGGDAWESIDALQETGWEPSQDDGLWNSGTTYGDLTVTPEDETAGGPTLSASRVIEMARAADAALVSARGRRRSGSAHDRFLLETHQFFRYVLWLSQEARGSAYASWSVSYVEWRSSCRGWSDEEALEALLSRFDLDRWRRLAAPGWVAAELISESEEIDEREPLHDEWHRACLDLAATRESIDQAKSRSEGDGELDAFYVMIGHCPSYRSNARRGSGCGRMREQLQALFEGAIEPETAAFCRAHLLECADCFWAFRDYTDDRILWGCRPQPAVAALRERLMAANSRLKLRIGALPTELSAILDQVRQASALASAAPGLSATSISDTMFLACRQMRTVEQPIWDLGPGRLAEQQRELHKMLESLERLHAMAERWRYEVDSWSVHDIGGDLEPGSDDLRRATEALQESLEQERRTVGETLRRISQLREEASAQMSRYIALMQELERQQAHRHQLMEAQHQVLPYLPGEPFEAQLLSAAGKVTGTATGRITSIEWDAEIRSGSVGVHIEAPADVRVVLAQAEVAGMLYSIAAELRAGEATLVITDLPEELGAFRAQRWYFLQDEADFLPGAPESGL